MKSKSQKIRLGIFVAFSTSVLIIMLALVGGSKFLKKRNTYYVAFENTSISGLEVGGTVKYLGVRIGRIEEINIDSEKLTRVIVTISLEDNIPIKEDVKAVISYVGITGLKLIELTGGTKGAPNLKVGSFIVTGKSITENITGKAGIISEKIERLLNNLLAITSGENKRKFISLVEETNKTLRYVNTLLRVNIVPLNKTFHNMALFSKELKPLLSNTNKAMVSLEGILANFSKTTHEISPKEIKKILENASETMIEARKAITHIDLTVVRGRSDLIHSLKLIRRSMQNISEVSRMLTEDPSILIRGVERGKGRQRR